MPNRSSALRFSRSRGFSLVEMLVAMVLGIIILFAVSELFISNTKTRSEIERTSQQIENGRYAVQLLADELGNAGFFGETLGPEFPAALPPDCPTTEAEVTDSMGVPVFGGNNVAVVSAPDCLGAYKASNDYIVIRRGSSCAVGSSGCDAFAAGQYHIQVSACQESDPGEITLGTSTGAMTAQKRSCESSDPAPVYRLLSRLYYVNDDDVLVRAELGDPAGASPYSLSPLVDGIERLHFEYGIDSDSDGAPNSYASAPAAAEWEDVVAVRIWLLARTLEETPGYSDERTYELGDADPWVAPGDGFKRRVYTTTVRINNVAGRRE